uniref:Uncharacterized protein n=1 Tax=Tanacetum cinerariifolium TaxID=118510 RepID=A0A6L2L2L2_TANCI|nr:hypothetical protein [Tanacetum cinerariifolium]
MDDPDIPIEEYIQLEAEKTRRHDQESNWETATYGKVMYFEDIDYIKDFENEFPAIVYEVALTSEPKESSEPTVSAHHAEKVDFDFIILFDESDDENDSFIYNKNSFSYKLVSVNDLKLDSNNDDDKFDIKQSSGDIYFEPLTDVISIDMHGSNNLLETSHDTSIMLEFRPSFTTYNLAHKRHMEDHTEQIP